MLIVGVLGAVDTEVLPKRIDIRLLFIALHMICVSNSPLAPTIPPIATSNRSLMARPAIAPATPLKLFNSDIVMGISAPPTLIEKTTPNSAEKIDTSKIPPTT